MSVPSATAADSTGHANGALAGPVVGLGLASRQVVPQDTLSDTARRVVGLSISAMGAGIAAPPVYILVTDPNGKRTGMHPGWAASVTEIASSRYFKPVDPDDTTWEPLEVVPLMDLPLAPGRYLIELAGVRERRYILDLSVERPNYRRFQGGQWSCPASPGIIDSLYLEVRADTAMVDRPCRGAL